MLLRTYAPGPPLGGFVALLWHSEGGIQPHAKERVLPDGSIEVVINLREDNLRVYDRSHPTRYESFGQAVVAGPHSEFVVIDTASQVSLMGVHFKPGGAFPFFRLPMDELRDTHVSLDELWGARAVELRQRLLPARTSQEMFRILERFLLAQTVRPLQRHPAVGFALQDFETAADARSIAEVADQIGLSQRRFIQLFRREVGLTPKVYGRIRRFQKVVRLVGTGRRFEWSDVALACGYFDQPHFIHDFRAFSGINPSTYVALRTEHLNHVPLGE
jgi:AraC-like DNA-binding protein